MDKKKTISYKARLLKFIALAPLAVPFYLITIFTIDAVKNEGPIGLVLFIIAIPTVFVGHVCLAKSQGWWKFHPFLNYLSGCYVPNIISGTTRLEAD